MGIDKAISIFATLAPTIFKEAKEKLQKAKDIAKNPMDWCFHETDEKISGERNHFPIYNITVAKKSVAQLKGLTELPNWWDGDELEELRQKGLNKIKSRWGDKIDINKIEAKQVKKKPIR